MSEKTNIPDFLALAEQLKKGVRIYAKVYCLNFFKGSFREQGFTDVSFEAWEKRKEPDRRPGGAILVDTTFLRNSLDVLNETANTMEFGTHTPYAAVHNNGERLRVIQYVRAHHNNNFMGKGKRIQIQAHARKIDTQYPKRQFIGHSTQMMQHLNDWLVKDIVKQFKQHLKTD